MIFTHPHPSAGGEVCSTCEMPASHKISEVTGDPRHPFTAYVCCGHFWKVMGNAAMRVCARGTDAPEAKRGDEASGE